jgi:hypothetical protein
MRRLIKQVADLQRVEPPAAGKADIFQDGEIELDLGGGLVLRRRGQPTCRRQIEGCGVEAPIVGLPDLGIAPGPAPSSPSLSPGAPVLAQKAASAREIVGIGAFAD